MSNRSRLLAVLFSAVASSMAEGSNKADMDEISPIIKAVKQAVSAQWGSSYADQPVTWTKLRPDKDYYHGFTPLAGRNFEFEYFPGFGFYRWRELTAKLDGAWTYVEYRKKEPRK